MVEEKGLPGAVADRIGEFVVLRGRPMELLEKLTEAMHPLALHAESSAALEELRLLFGFLQSLGALGPITFDLRWVRWVLQWAPAAALLDALRVGGRVAAVRPACAWCGEEVRKTLLSPPPPPPPPPPQALQAAGHILFLAPA